MNSGKKWLLIALALLTALSWGWYEFRYRLSYARDLEDRPWAYSKDPSAPLLVGKWQGFYKDPAGQDKQISLEIFLPVTEEERAAKAGRRVRNRKGLGSREDKHAFEGVATVASTKGAEFYEIRGSAGTPGPQDVRFSFSVPEDRKPPSSTYSPWRADPGRWEGKKLIISLHFNHRLEDGSIRTTSEGVVEDGKIQWKESPEEKPVSLVLSRAG